MCTQYYCGKDLSCKERSYGGKELSHLPREAGVHSPCSSGLPEDRLYGPNWGWKCRIGAFLVSNLWDWINLNGMLNCRFNPINPLWRILFPFAVWLIWKSKNQIVFKRKNQSLKLATNIMNQVMEYMHCVSSPRMPIYKKVKKNPLGVLSWGLDEI